MAEKNCNTCGKSFGDLARLNRHLRTVHQIEIPKMRISKKNLSPEDRKRENEEYQRMRYQKIKKEKDQQKEILDQKQDVDNLHDFFESARHLSSTQKTLLETEQRVQFELTLLSFRTQLVNEGFATISDVLRPEECSELLAELGESGFQKIFNTPSERKSKRMQKELNEKKYDI